MQVAPLSMSLLAWSVAFCIRVPEAEIRDRQTPRPSQTSLCVCGGGGEGERGVLRRTGFHTLAREREDTFVFCTLDQISEGRQQEVNDIWDWLLRTVLGESPFGRF